MAIPPRLWVSRTTGSAAVATRLAMNARMRSPRAWYSRTSPALGWAASVRAAQAPGPHGGQPQGVPANRIGDQVWQAPFLAAEVLRQEPDHLVTGGRIRHDRGTGIFVLG